MSNFSFRGFSLPEMMVALGLTAAVALGGVYLLKNVESDKKKINVQNDAHNLHKLIQAQLLTEKGCSSIKGKAPGSDLQIEGSSGQFHGAGKVIGNVRIETFRFTDFTEASPGSPNGLAEVEVSLAGKDADPSGPKVSDKRKIILAVNMKGGVVEDCKLNYSKAYAEMMEEICSKTWGSLTAGMTCPQAIAAVEAKIIEEMCRDVYGDGNFQIINGQCNLKLIHANKTCAQPGGLSGFTNTSREVCTPVVLNGGPSTPPTPPPANCTAWSNWSPDASTVCSGTSFSQTRNCTSGGTGSETRSATGLKSDGSCVSGCSAVSSVTWSSSGNGGCENGTTCYQKTNCYGTWNKDMTGITEAPTCEPTGSVILGQSCMNWSGNNGPTHTYQQVSPEMCGGSPSTCGGSIPSGTEGQSLSVNSTLAGSTGSAEYKCVSGSWQQQNATCEAATMGCTDASWSPDASSVCNTQTVTQTSNCGKTRQVTGTKSCAGGGACRGSGPNLPNQYKCICTANGSQCGPDYTCCGYMGCTGPGTNTVCPQ